ncbi:MAG: CRTAC1 family protein [Bacteroidetes bacterium]|nr:CRTAC1 family protein [Bacteroidota bacterium]
MRLFSWLTLFLSIIISLFVVSCSDVDREKTDSDSTPVSSNPNAEMARLLDSIRINTDPMDNYSLNEARAGMMMKRAQQMSDPNARFSMMFQASVEELRAGNTEKAINQLSGLVKAMEDGNMGLNDQTKLLYEMQALAYMRLGEEENCLGRPDPSSCILPLSPEAQHQMTRGSETAIPIYQRILEAYPDDLQSRWLLNIAYMTLGRYPEGVPAQYRIDPANFKQGAGEIDVWQNKAMALNVADNGLSGSVAMDDFNNDLLVDLFVTSYGLADPCKYYINTGNGFRDASKEAGLEGITGGLNVIHADYDNDGFLDVLVLRGAWFNKSGAIPNSLLRNNGNGTFTDVTKSAGILSFHPTQTAVWADFNNDGFLDLFIGNESTNAGSEFLSHPCEFYLNQQDGTFKDIAADLGLNIEKWVKSVSSGDINNDGFPDIYVSIPGEENLFFLNEGINPDGSLTGFREIGAAAGVRKPVLSFPSWFWDFNQDGYEDLMVVNYDFRNTGFAGSSLYRDFAGDKLGEEEVPALYQNNGDGTFSRMTEKMGIDHSIFGMGSNYGDLNNDGWLDFYIGTGTPDFRSVIPNRMFLSKGGEGFSEVTMQGFGHIQKGHGIAFGDYDNDGDEDIYAVMGGAYEGDISWNVLYENPGNDNNWIALKLYGTSSNRHAIGARIILTVKNPDGSSRKIYRTVSTGASFGSSSLRQTIGLGKAEEIESIEVIWPGETLPVRFEGEAVPGDYLKIKEGQTSMQKMELPAFGVSG